jgi:hypothetical protein
MLKIDPDSMKQAMREVAVAVGKSIEKEANHLLVVDSFVGMGEGAGYVSQFAINYTGALGKSSSTTMNNEGAGITWSAPYASNIEFGAEPHDPGYDSIYGWVLNKLKVTETDAANTAKNIQDKIKREGWEPRPFVRTAIHYVASDYVLTGV